MSGKKRLKVVDTPVVGLPVWLQEAAKVHSNKSGIDALSQSDDVARDIMKGVGDHSIAPLAGARVLLGIYIAPEKTKGGILRPTEVKKEDIYQGNVGLVLLKGPLAFKDDDRNSFGGFSPEVGQWVVYNAGDAKRVQINGVDCRYIEDSLIHQIVPDPSMITHRM